jgi:phosphopantothenoylcysteine decarboxylase/phosphopantothenate--cysteine ligase
MSPLRILLGVSGGIAAYKSAEIVRLLRGRGHDVRCALTRGGATFVSPLTLEVLSGHPLPEEDAFQVGPGSSEAHIEAAAWADVVCIAPLTAHLLARMALGLADDFLSTLVLAYDGPLVLAPAMHTKMWEQVIVQTHAATMVRRGAVLVGPVAGPLASGEVGMGRLSEPVVIVEAIERIAGGLRPLSGRTVLVTAGPTYEPLDPVRFIGNRSSGKMGFALAAEAASRGAHVVLVAGPVSLETPRGVERVDVTTAIEMERAVDAAASSADLIVMAAAVADFRPASPQALKIKRASGIPTVELIANPDILGGLRPLAPRAVIVGFAAETDDVLAHAREKLDRKGVDFLIANDVSRSDIAFGSEQNEVVVLTPGNSPQVLSRRPKNELAVTLLDIFSQALSERERRPFQPA